MARSNAGRVKHTALPGTVVYCNGLKVISTRRFCALPSAVLLLAIGFAGPIPLVRIRLASTPGDQRAGDGVSTLLRQTHIQIVATGTVGVAHHIDGGLGILFQHHRHAGQRVSACRFQRRAAAVEGDIIRHIQNDIIAASRHANACAPHFVTQFRFLYVHVVTHAAAQRRASRRANQRAFTAIFFEEESAPMPAPTSDPIPAPMPDLPASRSPV